MTWILLPCILGALSGTLLYISGPPHRLWFLQGFALLPWLAAVLPNDGPEHGFLAALLASLALALFYLVPLILVLRMVPVLAVGLGLYQTVIWVAAGTTIHFVGHWPAPWSGLGAGACLAFLAWLEFTLLPAWGTAQCFARPMSAAPACIQFVALTGITGIVFVLTAAPALLLGLWLQPQHRALSLGAFVIVVAGPGLYNWLAWRRRPDDYVKVATMGWLIDLNPAGLMQDRYLPLLSQAAEGGARLVVSPEAAFPIADRLAWDDLFGGLAKSRRVTLATGIFDENRSENRILFFDETGKLLDEYTKTHLVPFAESYRRGTGKRARIPLDGHHLGGLICQDDNFTDIARGYGRDGVQLLAVPTHDWKSVREFHLENSILRAIEGRYGLVRAAANGISAIIAPQGKVLARQDHYLHGPGLLVADMPIFNGPTTVYARYGDWFPMACWVALVLGCFLFR